MNLSIFPALMFWHWQTWPSLLNTNKGEWELFSICFENRLKDLVSCFFLNFSKISFNFSFSCQKPGPPVEWVRRILPLQSTQSFLTMGSCNSLERLSPWAGLPRTAASYLVWIWCCSPLGELGGLTGLAGFIVAQLPPDPFIQAI